MDKLIKDPELEQIRFHLGSIRIREEDKEPTVKSLFPIATKATDELIEKVNQETAETEG